MSRTDIDVDELPQIALGTAERRLLANLPLKSEMLDCTLKFLYKSSHTGNLQFLNSLPVQFRLVPRRLSVDLQQVWLQHHSHRACHMPIDTSADVASPFCPAETTSAQAIVRLCDSPTQCARVQCTRRCYRRDSCGCGSGSAMCSIHCC